MMYNGGSCLGYVIVDRQTPWANLGDYEQVIISQIPGPSLSILSTPKPFPISESEEPYESVRELTIGAVHLAAACLKRSQSCADSGTANPRLFGTAGMEAWRANHGHRVGWIFLVLTGGDT